MDLYRIYIEYITFLLGVYTQLIPQRLVLYKTETDIFYTKPKHRGMNEEEEEEEQPKHGQMEPDLDIEQPDSDVEELEIEGDIEELEVQGDLEELEFLGDIEELEVQGDIEELEVQGDFEELEVQGDIEELEVQGDIEELEVEWDLEKLKLPGDLGELLLEKAPISNDVHPPIQCQTTAISNDAQPPIQCQTTPISNDPQPPIQCQTPLISNDAQPPIQCQTPAISNYALHPIQHQTPSMSNDQKPPIRCQTTPTLQERCVAAPIPDKKTSSLYQLSSNHQTSQIIEHSDQRHPPSLYRLYAGDDSQSSTSSKSLCHPTVLQYAYDHSSDDLYNEVNSGVHTSIIVDNLLHPLVPNECQVYKSLTDNAPYSTMCPATNHRLNEEEEIDGFGFTIPHTEMACKLPIARQIGFRHTMVECVNDTPDLCGNFPILVPYFLNSFPV
jgi:hypothetical protein